MLDSLRNSSTLEQGLFILAAGLIGVFIVLVLFYFSIKLITKLFPYKNEKNREEK